MFDGELSIDWSFSPQMFSGGQIRYLADDYVAEPMVLADLCYSSSRYGATPSDFSSTGLDQVRPGALSAALGGAKDIHPPPPIQQGMLFHSLYE